MAITTFEANTQTVSLKDMIANAAFSAITGVENLVAHISETLARRATINQISNLSDEMLSDIGLTRGDIENIGR